MYNYSPGIRDQQAIWDVVQKSLLSPNVYPNAGLSPQQSPSMPGFFAQPGSSVYSKSMPAPPSAEESAARIRGDIGQQEAQIFQNLQSQGVLPPTAEGYGQAIRSISKPQTMGGVMTIDQQTGAPNYLIQPTPINQPGGMLDYSPPVSDPTPQQPTIYGTKQTPYAIPTSFTSQESPTMQAARLKPLQQDPTWVAQAYGGEAAKTLQAQQVAQQKASQEASQEQMKFNRDALLQQMKGKFELDQTQIKADSDFKIKMYEAEVASGKMNRQDAEKQYGYESQYLNAIGKIDDAYNEAADEYAFMNNGKYEGFEKTATAQGLQKMKQKWDDWRKGTEPEGMPEKETVPENGGYEPYTDTEIQGLVNEYLKGNPGDYGGAERLIQGIADKDMAAGDKQRAFTYLNSKKKPAKPKAKTPVMPPSKQPAIPPTVSILPSKPDWLTQSGLEPIPNLPVAIPKGTKRGFRKYKAKKKPNYIVPSSSMFPSSPPSGSKWVSNY